MKKPKPHYRDTYTDSQIENLYQAAANGDEEAAAEYEWATRDHKVFGQP